MTHAHGAKNAGMFLASLLRRVQGEAGTPESLEWINEAFVSHDPHLGVIVVRESLGSEYTITIRETG